MKISSIFFFLFRSEVQLTLVTRSLWGLSSVLNEPPP